MDPVTLTARLLLAVLVISTANALLWLFRERAAWRLIKPYPFSTLISVTSPFSRRWRSLVNPADLDAITSFRKGFLLNYYMLLVVPAVALSLLVVSLSYAPYVGAERDLIDTEQRPEEVRQALQREP